MFALVAASSSSGWGNSVLAARGRAPARRATGAHEKEPVGTLAEHGLKIKDARHSATSQWLEVSTPSLHFCARREEGVGFDRLSPNGSGYD
jgi:hypothetical protein